VREEEFVPTGPAEVKAKNKTNKTRKKTQEELF